MAYNRTILSILLIIFGNLLCVASPPRERISLHGDWRYYLTDAPDSIPHSGILTLPGTLDSNSIGVPVAITDDTDHLARRFTYTGEALFSQTIVIPEDWKGKAIELFIERTRPSSVAVDGINAGDCRKISSPHRYDLTNMLTPGVHVLEISIDNGKSIPQTVRDNSHACTESTQTNWNGMIGEIYLEAKNTFHLKSVAINSDFDNGTLIIKTRLSKPSQVPLTLKATSGNGTEAATVIFAGDDDVQLTLKLPDDHTGWSEWNPSTTVIRLSLLSPDGELLDMTEQISGLRKFEAAGTQFFINGKSTFLRGRHDGCVFPLTAHPPMDVESWRKYFSTLKEYGLNHVRFHSWCPPEECFMAADEAGVYLQPELPIWGEIDEDRTDLMDFLTEDFEGIMESYSSHPSFTMFAIGNELWGDISLMRKFIDRARQMNPGLLATYGSNTYLGWNGHIEGEDYLVAARVGEGVATHARGSFSFADTDDGGVINACKPNSTATFSNAVAMSPVPLVSHETGQYQSYPDFNSISKYTGVLRPDNLTEFRRLAEEAGTLRKADKFFNASGKWAAKLYGAETEMALRTPGMGGFQILDIQDYPGQGTALVGILDPFMDSKGFVTPEEWRHSCAETVLLAELPKRCFSSGEMLTIPIKAANFSGKDLEGGVDWNLPFAKGFFPFRKGSGLMELGSISISLPRIKEPKKFTLNLTADNGQAANSYDIWVYPQKMRRIEDVILTSDIDFALSALQRGEKVILAPDSSTVAPATLGPLFTTDFWNYRMFRTICDKLERKPSPGTLGLLIDESHPAFKKFPTSFHSDWQWFEVVNNSYPLIIDRLPKEVDPIVEVIDNVERNYRLALMLECYVGKGKLMIISADAEKLGNSPEGEWLLQSVKEYMASKECKPDLSLTPEQIVNLLTKPSTARLIKELRNESYGF